MSAFVNERPSRMGSLYTTTIKQTPIDLISILYSFCFQRRLREHALNPSVQMKWTTQKCRHFKEIHQVRSIKCVTVSCTRRERKRATTRKELTFSLCFIFTNIKWKKCPQMQEASTLTATASAASTKKPQMRLLQTRRRGLVSFEMMKSMH